MTAVFDLNTGTYTDYMLPPMEAVAAAYAQRELRDWNTWDYAKYRGMVTEKASIKPGVRIVTCGNQSALMMVKEQQS